MKIDPSIRAQLANLEPNQVGLLAWSLLAFPQLHAGGIPGQPDPDSPQPIEPDHGPDSTRKRQDDDLHRWPVG